MIFHSNENPADDCSGGLGMKRHSRVKRYFRDPDFLWKPMSTWQNNVDYYEVDDNDKEVKITKINSVQIKNDILSTLDSKISSWRKMKRVMAYMMLLN